MTRPRRSPCWTVSLPTARRVAVVSLSRRWPATWRAWSASRPAPQTQRTPLGRAAEQRGKGGWFHAGAAHGELVEARLSKRGICCTAVGYGLRAHATAGRQ